MSRTLHRSPTICVCRSFVN